MFDLIFTFIYPVLVPFTMAMSFRRNDNIAWSLASAFFGHIYFIYWLFVSKKGDPLFKGLTHQQKNHFLKLAIAPSVTFYISTWLGVVYYDDMRLSALMSLISLLAMVGMFVFPAIGLKKVRTWRSEVKKN